MRTFKTRKRRLGAVAELDVRTLAGGGVVPSRGVGYSGVLVGPIKPVPRESMAASSIEPPLRGRAGAVHVVEDSVVVSIIVDVQELILGSRSTEIGEELDLVLDARLRVLPV